MIRVVCGCGRVFKAEDRHAGKRTKCPVCGTMLTIGGTPVSSSSGGDFDEVPSWWYPRDPLEQPGPGATLARGGGDVEALRTAVFPSGAEPRRGAVVGNHAPVSIAGKGARARSLTRAFSRVRQVWALSVAAAALAVLALGAMLWMRLAVAQGGRAPRGAGGASAESRDPEPNPPITASPRAMPTEPAPAGTGKPPVAATPAPMGRRLRLLVPAYIYPADDGLKEWRRLIAVASKVDIVAVANPDSGPGPEYSPDYAAIIGEASSRGVKVVGYVNTEYSRRPSAAVKKDIDTWVEFYPQIAGLFFDQQSVQARHADYYADLRAYAKGKLHDTLVITNPGSLCDRAYLARPASDVACVFAYEGVGVLELPDDLRAYEPSRFAALAYKVADVETMRAMVKDAVVKRIGYIYITDGKPSNQWNKLPAYWEAEVDAVSQVQ